MSSPSLIVIDIGGTKINVGHFYNGKIVNNAVHPFTSTNNADEVLHFVITRIKQLEVTKFEGIAIGVPSIVDVENGIIYDTVNIAAWQKFPLKSLLEQEFNVPVYVNNDVNCFAVGESLNEGREAYSDLVGICLGTGFGAGIILNRQLYVGQNCCAGEVGGIHYLERTIDDYCSGQFFKNYYNQCGSELAKQARQGDKRAQFAFVEFGHHLANAITNLLFVIDPQMIVIGGSVSHSFDLFIDAVWEKLADFPYQRVIDNLKIEKSTLSNSALLGAAHLYQQSACNNADYSLIHKIL